MGWRKIRLATLRPFFSQYASLPAICMQQFVAEFGMFAKHRSHVALKGSTIETSLLLRCRSGSPACLRQMKGVDDFRAISRWREVCRGPCGSSDRLSVGGFSRSPCPTEVESFCGP